MESNGPQDFFTTFEYKCTDCKNWKIHQVLASSTEFIENSHFTCICHLLRYGAVCCPQGFRLLLEEQPELVTKLKSPPTFTTLTMLLKQNFTGGLNDDDAFLECKEIFQSANIKKMTR